MTIRRVVTVDRGMTDKTAVVVFPWEIPLLEVIHGGGEGSVVEHSIDDLCSTKGQGVVARLKLRHAAEHAPDLRAQLEAMLNSLPEEIDPFSDPQGEFDRMAAIYGMHPEVRQSVVENVYGNYRNGAFAKFVQSVKAGAPTPASEDEDEPGEPEVTADPVDAMDGAQVREALTALGATFKGNDAVAKLKTRLKLINKLNEDMIDFDVNAPVEELQALVEALA